MCYYPLKIDYIYEEKIMHISGANIKIVLIDDTNIEDYKEQSIYREDCLAEIYIKKSCFKNIIQSDKNEFFVSEDILSSREKEVLKFLSKGLNNHQIAKELNISVHTAKAHVHNIFEKLSVKDRTNAVVKAIQHRLINI